MLHNLLAPNLILIWVIVSMTQMSTCEMRRNISRIIASLSQIFDIWLKCQIWEVCLKQKQCHLWGSHQMVNVAIRFGASKNQALAFHNHVPSTVAQYKRYCRQLLTVSSQSNLISRELMILTSFRIVSVNMYTTFFKTVRSTSAELRIKFTSFVNKVIV